MHAYINTIEFFSLLYVCMDVWRERERARKRERESERVSESESESE